MPDWIGTFQNRARHAAQNGVNTALTLPGRVFPGLFTHWGICPPPSYGGGQVQGDKALIRGTHEGGHRPYGGGGANFDRLSHKLKVLLMLSCNYTMQFIAYDSIKTR